MGLDMYLYKKTYVKNYEHMPDKYKHYITVMKNNENVSHIKPERIAYIVEEVGYWRKANAIHNWFVKNVQEGEDDCSEYYVSKEALEALLETVNKALETKDYDNYLPTKSGFFFGDTKYSDWYIKELEYTKNLLKTILSGDDLKYSSIHYQSSW